MLDRHFRECPHHRESDQRACSETQNDGRASEFTLIALPRKSPVPIVQPRPIIATWRATGWCRPFSRSASSLPTELPTAISGSDDARFM